MTKAFAGPRNSRGTQVYPAFPWDSGVAAEGVSIPGILTTGARSPVGPPIWESINVDQLEDRVAASGMERLTNTAYWTNLTSFFGRGGKILFTTVRAIRGSPALDTVNYYERMAANFGGMEQVREQSSRVYLVPGMGHCTSGATLDRFDLLSAVVELGGRRQGAQLGGRDRPGVSRPQPAALRLSATCAVQGAGRSGKRRQLRMQIVEIIHASRWVRAVRELRNMEIKLNVNWSWSMSCL